MTTKTMMIKKTKTISIPTKGLKRYLLSVDSKLSTYYNYWREYVPMLLELVL
jgi:hypothetical protein